MQSTDHIVLHCADEPGPGEHAALLGGVLRAWGLGDAAAQSLACLLGQVAACGGLAEAHVYPQSRGLLLDISLPAPNRDTPADTSWRCCPEPPDQAEADARSAGVREGERRAKPGTGGDGGTPEPDGGAAPVPVPPITTHVPDPEPDIPFRSDPPATPASYRGEDARTVEGLRNVMSGVSNATWPDWTPSGAMADAFMALGRGESLDLVAGMMLVDVRDLRAMANSLGGCAPDAVARHRYARVGRLLGEADQWL